MPGSERTAQLPRSQPRITIDHEHQYALDRLCTKAFMPPMLERKSGNIIFVSSVAGLNGLPNEPIYCATKFAQMGFAQSIDYECYPNNVKVTVVAPGGTNTHYGFYNGTRTPGDPMLDGFQEAEDVADAVVFAATQPPKSRVFMVWMMPVATRDSSRAA
jgi:3-oxoacyl-[acyl-carrier protein] reductase